MDSIEKEMVHRVDEFEKIKKEKVFDMSVPNALANANIDTSMKVNKALTK